MALSPDALLAPERLVSLYAEVDRDLLNATREADAIAAVARLAVSSIPGVEQASISEGRPEQTFRTLSSTGDMASIADRIQYELNSGPCVDAMVKDAVFRTGDLAADPRWPVFSARARAEADAVSMMSLRLFLERDDRVAGLNLYSSQPDAFDDAAEIVAGVVATHTALAVVAATASERAANLERALKSNRRIGMAMGVLMAAHKLTEEDAFTLLRIASQNTNRKLLDVAEEVITTGTIALPAPKPASARPVATKPRPVPKGTRNGREGL